MSKNPWNSPVSADEAHRRAGGRRHYHAQRYAAMILRQLLLVKRLARDGYSYGMQARLARELGVSEATISRDLAALRGKWQSSR